MRRLSLLLLLSPALFACDGSSSTQPNAEFRDHSAEPLKSAKPGFVMTCAELFGPALAGQLPWLESIEPGVGQFPSLSVSCEELLEVPPNSDVSHGQSICTWKVADYVGLELDALEFALWEDEDGETVCGCRCPRCQAEGPAPQAYDEIGEGTLAAPYEIYNEEQLADLGMNQAGWDANYLQCADIDLEPYYSEGGGVFSVGENTDFLTNPFTGSYDGDEWEIANFRGELAWPYPNVALFGHVQDATLRNITMVDPTEVWAGLVFRADDSDLNNLSVGGGLATQAGIVGLLFGGEFNRGRANIEVFGSNLAGGAVRAAEGAVLRDVAAYGSVTGSHAGGLVSGAVSSLIVNCEAHGDVEGTQAAGGLAASVGGTGLVSRSFATGNATAEQSVGGLAGQLSGGAAVEWSYATGDATGTSSNSRAGGLVGMARTQSTFAISNSYALGDVVGGMAGGLASGDFWTFIEPGSPQSSIESCYAAGDVTATGPTNPIGNTPGYAGGLTAFEVPFTPFVLPPSISHSFSMGTPSSNDDFSYGYMVGPNAYGPTIGYNVEAQTGNQNGQGTAASESAGDFQNPTLPPLNMNWVEGPDAWDFSEPLPTIPSAGVN